MVIPPRLRQTGPRPACAGRLGSCAAVLSPQTAILLAALVVATSLAAFQLGRASGPLHGLPNFLADDLGAPRNDSGSAGWHTFEHGVTRSTPWGQETITVGAGSAARYLTVSKHRGVRVWTLPLTPHGATIPPVRILDANGKDLTHANLTWAIRKVGGRWRLHVRLADSSLPLPYVIEQVPAAPHGIQTH